MPSLVDYLSRDVPFAFLVSQVYGVVDGEGLGFPQSFVYLLCLFCPAFFSSLLHIGVVDDLMRYCG